MDWHHTKSEELYGVKHWGSGYFRVSEKGHVVISPNGDASSKIDLFELVEDLKERGIGTPILIRLADIVKSRVDLLSDCFNRAITEYEYESSYQGVYPIKVNQQRHLVEEIVNLGQERKLGLECGSKPELLVALALMETPGALIICNGFKDQEYIETALLAQKLGRKTFIVVDRKPELDLIIKAAKKLGIRPNIGFRVKLNSQGAGKWMESSGVRSKFGLSPSEIVEGVQTLKDEAMLDCLVLIHFHIGSQITSIQSIKSSVKEAARYYTEIHSLGARPGYIDVGGGLGIDYDGSVGKSDHSVNYSEQEYANDVVSILQTICDEKNVPSPHIITEAGRSIVAHSSILVFDVLGCNSVSVSDLDFEVSESDSRLVRELYEIYTCVSEKNLNEFYNDLQDKKRDSNNMFSYGVLTLKQKARAEKLILANHTKMVAIARNAQDLEDIYWDLEKDMSDTYFCNFSVFQSLPDSWALEQVFPIMPIHRLDEQPQRRAVLADLTCDSDGKINRFIDLEEGDHQPYLEVHDFSEEEPYYLAAFLTGAYQETLGDLHNLFGDTNAVHVSINGNGHSVSIDHVVEGDSIEEVLSYVEYSKPDLIEKIRRASEESIARGSLTKLEAKLLMQHYQRALAGSPYLEESDE
ncbi:MAG: biosynthetic arginine decarboxylase [Candidatus Lindowbacteria bacterium]|nr:biosynthetic arginine decarboxylase [Candidatus Lindowbacteria bacterium]